MRIVWLAEKPSLRAASCCKVEVVKGGGGLRVGGLVSTDWTVKRPASTAVFAAMAVPSSPMLSRSTFSPLNRTRRAKQSVPSTYKVAKTLQYSSARGSAERRVGTECVRHGRARWTTKYKQK